ncbi:MAG: VWA domain-containing protein [Myxococcota bacterium]
MPTPDDELLAFRDSRRRRTLLLAGTSLLALGIALNLPRLFPATPPSVEAMSRPLDGAAEAEEYEGSDDEAGGSGTRHKGEEGKMGKPSSKSKTGLYAMKGPKNAQPQMARDFDVWGGLTGTEVGEAYGVGGLGLTGTGRGGGGTGQGIIGLGNTGLIGKGSGSGHFLASPAPSHPDEPMGPSGMHAVPPNPTDHTHFIAVADDPKSTFSIDVDTASYSSTRRSITRSRTLPPADSVRVEEFINYFDYDYAQPEGEQPFSITAEVGECPWAPDHQLVHVGLQGRTLATDEVPPRNLVFLIDASGSMHSHDKLPLVKHALTRLTRTLRAEDRISLVVYAGNAGVRLMPTPGNEHEAIIAALDRLESGGGTNGGAGIQRAYQLAQQSFIEGGVNRVLLATDGDFNVGVASHDALVRLIERKRRSGVELSVLGFGIGHSDHTMEQLADKGNGNYAYIDDRQEAEKVLVEQSSGTLVTIAKDVKLQVGFDPAKVQSYRLIGYDNRRLAHKDFADDTKDAGEIGAGHTVTALYEVVPQPEAPADAPWMTVDLRHKAPKGSRSSLHRVPVVADALDLDDTSDDFRFSAAVASFGLRLSGDTVESGDEDTPEQYAWSTMRELAAGSLGEDSQCRRHQFVGLVSQAAMLSGDTELEPLDVRCTPNGTRHIKPVPPPEPVVDAPPPQPDLLAPTDEPPPQRPARGADESPEDEPGWGDQALEVLRLLPPLLAFPLFVMAYRRPRRRREF